MLLQQSTACVATCVWENVCYDFIQPTLKRLGINVKQNYLGLKTEEMLQRPRVLCHRMIIKDELMMFKVCIDQTLARIHLLDNKKLLNNSLFYCILQGFLILVVITRCCCLFLEDCKFDSYIKNKYSTGRSLKKIPLCVWGIHINGYVCSRLYVYYVKYIVLLHSESILKPANCIELSLVFYSCQLSLL